MKLNFYFADNIEGFKKFGGDVIKAVEKTSYSHFAVGLECDDEVIYEAVFPKSRKIKKEEWLKEYKIIYSFSYEIPKNKFIEVYEFLESLIGRWYAIEQCIFIAFVIWFKIKKSFINNKSKRIICTELGYLVAKRFFDFYYSANQDHVDLNEMFHISVLIEEDQTWL